MKRFGWLVGVGLLPLFVNSPALAFDEPKPEIVSSSEPASSEEGSGEETATTGDDETARNATAGDDAENIRNVATQTVLQGEWGEPWIVEIVPRYVDPVHRRGVSADVIALERATQPLQSALFSEEAEWDGELPPPPMEIIPAWQRPSYREVYESVPFIRAEYDANPSYRHEATMEILFGQLRPMTIHKVQPVPPQPLIQSVVPYAFRYGRRFQAYHFWYPHPRGYRRY